MIGISKLYCHTVEASDPLRYGRQSKDLPSHLLQFSSDKKPVVVWNVGRRCNLRCVHCYSRSWDKAYAGELTHEEGMRLIDVLGAVRVPRGSYSNSTSLAYIFCCQVGNYKRFKRFSLKCSFKATSRRFL